MEDASWDRMVDAIDARFGLASHGRTKRPVAEGHELTESVAFITFERDGDMYMLERVTGPAIIDRKTVGARRAGATVHYEFVYDPDEEARKTILYRKAGDDWELLDPSALQL